MESGSGRCAQGDHVNDTGWIQPTGVLSTDLLARSPLGVRQILGSALNPPGAPAGGYICPGPPVERNVTGEGDGCIHGY